MSSRSLSIAGALLSPTRRRLMLVSRVLLRQSAMASCSYCATPVLTPRYTQQSSCAHHHSVGAGKNGGRHIPYAVTISTQWSGRQDSNLRSLVPQTSAYFQAEGRVQLECFRRVLVGKSTSPRKLESAGIECTQLALSRPTEVARSLPYFGGRPRLERAIHTLLRVLAPFP